MTSRASSRDGLREVQASGPVGLSQRGRLAARLVALVVTIAVALSLFRVIVRDGPAALEAWSSTTVEWTWVFIASTLGFCGHALYLIGWKRLLTDLRLSVTYWELVEYFLVSTLGRYLPAGKAWQMGIIGVMASRRGQPGAIIAGTSLVQALVGVAVGLLMLSATAGYMYRIPPIWNAVPSAGIVALLLSPWAVRRSARVLALSSRFLPSLTSLSVATMWALVWTAAASWIAWGLALNALARSVSPEVELAVATYFSAWAGPFLAGLLAVVSPAGAGVREGVMQGLLVAGGVVPSTALVIVASARAWSLLIDVPPAVAVVALASHRLKRTRRQSAREQAATECEPAANRLHDETE